jgi:hypothetical protein
MEIRSNLLTLAIMTFLAPQVASAATFGEDLAFLQRYIQTVVLEDTRGAKLVVAPQWQGRVMTSTAAGDSGPSFGWINRELIASGKLQPHINVFGGEDRFWLGPEGGQFSIFFKAGVPFDLEHWFTPEALDTMPYRVERSTATNVKFKAEFALTNYSGCVFEIGVTREVSLLSRQRLHDLLKLDLPNDVASVGFESVNELRNRGNASWTKDRGLLSIWILGMFNHSPATTIVGPIKAGSEQELGPKVTSDYFGTIPLDRLKVTDRTVFLSGDGKFRSKIGISPRRSTAVLGSYDGNKVLTIVRFTQPQGAVDYVNSLWKLQDNPYGGDASNSYNDGPPSPGAKPLGPFYELESSSPAAALAPGQTLTHVHSTIHLTGPRRVWTA